MKAGRRLLHQYKGQDIPLHVLVSIAKEGSRLTAAGDVHGALATTNIIESYNPHLQGRLKTIKGFESFQSAKQCLNAYIIKLRFTKFTDCGEIFRHLNGKTSISQTLKKGAICPLSSI